MPSHQIRVRRNYEPEPSTQVTNDAAGLQSSGQIQPSGAAGGQKIQEAPKSEFSISSDCG
jgi:hypothetical protein